MAHPSWSSSGKRARMMMHLDSNAEHADVQEVAFCLALPRRWGRVMSLFCSVPPSLHNNKKRTDQAEEKERERAQSGETLTDTPTPRHPAPVRPRPRPHPPTRTSHARRLPDRVRKRPTPILPRSSTFTTVLCLPVRRCLFISPLIPLLPDISTSDTTSSTADIDIAITTTSLNPSWLVRSLKASASLPP